MKFEIKIQSETVELAVTRRGDRLQITLPDGRQREVTVLEQADGQLLLQDGSRLLPVAGHAQGNLRQLWQAGKTLSYTRVTKASAGGDDSAAGSLSASIPAVVTELLVAVGDEVAAGDKLILLESMKMVIPITAPTAGTVTGIHAAAGESVQPNVPLVTLATAE